MTSLPPGWAADYDGKRWFFTYGPTGQSQFQFPRPGDEFPDFSCCAGAAASAVPAVELMPEERLESEKQVRRVLRTSGSETTKSTGKVDDVKGGLLRGRESPGRGGDGGGNRTICFESFAATNSRGGWGLGVSRERNKTVEQRGCCAGDGAGILAPTNVAENCKESTGEPISRPLVIKGEHALANSSPHRGVCSAATIAIMSEPVLAAVETTAAAPSLSDRGQRPAGSEAQLSPLELPMLGGRAIDSKQTPLWALSVGGVPELYSESTALCEHEINPPPVELPGNDEGWHEHIVRSNSAVQNSVELPVYEGPGISSKKGSSTAGLETESCAAISLADDYAATSKSGPGQTTGAKSRGHDRAGLPSQISRVSSKVTLRQNSFCDNMDSVPGQEPPTRDTDQPVGISGTGRRDPEHFPSILRPGPRRSEQLPPQRTGTVMPPPAANTSHAARVHFYQPQEHQHKGFVSQEQSARMPAMPLIPHLHGVPTATSKASPAAPNPDGAGQIRLPGSVNFVIPIQHIFKGEPQPAMGSAVEEVPPSYRYRVSASFASAKSPEIGAQGSDGSSPGLLPGRKTEPWSWGADEDAAPARLVSGKSAAEVPEWSWGYAR